MAETPGNDQKLDLSYNRGRLELRAAMGLLQTSPSLGLDLSETTFACTAASCCEALATEKDKQPCSGSEPAGAPGDERVCYLRLDSEERQPEGLNLNDTGIRISSLINVADALTTDNRTIEVFEIGNPKLTTLGLSTATRRSMLACNPNIRTST